MDESHRKVVFGAMIGACRKALSPISGAGADIQDRDALTQ